MRIDFAGSCPKDLSEPDANEDKFAVATDGSRAALCDGASESYDSRLWASQLAARFIRDPAVNAAWVEEAVQAFNAAYDLDAMSWSKQLAFERGSFATLLGVEHDRDHGVVDVLAVGDCVALLMDGEDLIGAWPFDDPERFKEHPTLLATLAAHNSFVGELGFYTGAHRTWHLGEYMEPRLLCISDALAEWVLRQAHCGSPRLSRLVNMRSEEELCELVITEREAKRVRIDDSTLLVMSFAPSTVDDAVPNP